MKQLLAAIAILGFASPRGAIAQSPAPAWAPTVDSMMRSAMTRLKIPGAQIAIAQSGRLVYSRGYGVADIESGRPVSDRTLFQVGSNAKMITGALLAQLSAEGLVDLKAPISSYVPELAGRQVGTATIHRLLTNSSGWGDVARPFGTTDESELARLMPALGDSMILLEPGRVYSYSNPGFSMAAYVAERVMKTPFAELAERLVLRKMGMPRATFRPMVAMTHDFALGHIGDSAGNAIVQRPMPWNATDAPSGFLWISAPELARLGMTLIQGGMLDGQRVMSTDAVRAMTTGVIRVPTAPKTWAGYGMHMDTVAGHRFWRKAGSVPGYYTEITMWPDLQLVAVVSANRLDEFPSSATILAAELVTGKHLQRDPPPVEPPPTPEQRRELIGTYRARRGTVMITEVDGRLEYHAPRATYPIRMLSATRLIAEPPGRPPQPGFILRDANGRIEYLYFVNAVVIKQP